LSGNIFRGVLVRDGEKTFLRGRGGEEYFSDSAIWDGYWKHWQVRMLCGRILPEKDYITEKNIVLLWPDGLFDTSDPERPYLDKFGRQFMRTIHVARITGRETSGLESILRRKLKDIFDTPVDSAEPEYYRDFSKFSNICTTIIRDSLREWGFDRVKGIFPGEMFISAVWEFRKRSKSGGFNLSVFTRDQLMVDEAPASTHSPILNPVNFVKNVILNAEGI
jgi:hypothetical protein